MKTSTQRVVALVLVVALFAAAIAGITQVVTADAQQRQTDDAAAHAWMTSYAADFLPVRGSSAPATRADDPPHEICDDQTFGPDVVHELRLTQSTEAEAADEILQRLVADGWSVDASSLPVVVLASQTVSDRTITASLERTYMYEGRISAEIRFSAESPSCPASSSD